MTTAALLDPRAAEHLCKLLGMLGSRHDGERAAAAWKVHEFIRQIGLTWPDIIISVPMVPADWRRMATACREQGYRLTPREFDFVNNIAMRGREPSEKQLKWLRDIFARLGGGT
jgi:hypothetical protein